MGRRRERKRERWEMLDVKKTSALEKGVGVGLVFFEGKKSL